jgi:hypothetical protein
MTPRRGPWVPLAPLFTTLLAGCNTAENPCEGVPDMPYSMRVLLTPAEYEQWQQGKQPGSLTTGDPTTGDPIPTTGPSTATDDGTGGTGGSTAGDTASDSTAADTTDTASSTAADTAGTMLSDQEICAMVCSIAGYDYQTCTIGAIDGSDQIAVDCSGVSQCIAGRRHACVRSHGDAAGTSPAATWLARAAHDEAASVHAFIILGDELLAHDAPSDLLARIATAADDERRHAALVTDLAQRHGAVVPMPIITPTPTRDLLALAVENMVEGCVGETWAALVAAHQSHHAQTPELRDLFKNIAADETRHAELAWSIHTWLIGQLSAAGQAMVATARRQAVHQLRTSLPALDEPALLALGVPDRPTALHLIAGLNTALWGLAA